MTQIGLHPVLPWTTVEPAARELLRILCGDHDLRWAAHVWQLIPSEPDGEAEFGIDKARSLVTLCSLTLLFAAFVEVALEETDHDVGLLVPDAMEAIGLDPFFLGQLSPWPPATLANGKPDFGRIGLELARDQAPLLVALLRAKYGTDALLLSCFTAEHCIHDQDHDCDDDEHGLNLTDGREFAALQWIARRCPI